MAAEAMQFVLGSRLVIRHLSSKMPQAHTHAHTHTHTHILKKERE